MALDAWLPIGFKLPDGAMVRTALFEGTDWQIYETMGGGRALVALNLLAERWLDAGLIEDGTFSASQFGDRQIRSISCGPSQSLGPVSEAKSPDNKAEALAFALALKATREEALAAFAATHRSCDPPPDYVSSTGASIADWLQGVRRAARAGSLSTERLKRLQSLPGWSPETRRFRAASNTRHPAPPR